MHISLIMLFSGYKLNAFEFNTKKILNQYQNCF